jgi:putative DNA methylase
VLFASLVDDPSADPDQFPTEEAQEAERERLFAILRELVKWENSNNEYVLEQARKEILKSTGGNPPPVLDPFCGGGSIPLEAQRLGLKAYASDLNPVAVLITKALIEIPPQFAGQPPVNPESRSRIGGGDNWRGAAGLAEDVRYYGRWMRDEAWKRIGHLYPKLKLPKEYGGGDATVIAWLWARTVKCPNPACGVQMPLVRSFVPSAKQNVWVEPVVNRAAKIVQFKVRSGECATSGSVSRKGARCCVCASPVQLEYIRSESRAGRMSARLMAVVCDGRQSRVYASPSDTHAMVGAEARPSWRPEGAIADNPGHTNVYRYGLTSWDSLFTPRQLVALSTFSDLVSEARGKVLADGGSEPYANAMATLLSLAVCGGPQG